ncbi:hypothetical protein [Streptomyces sp. CAI-85]|uniref:hypothetical protein n=1 Tax=Streptomyces sp. CAI-85 TaxID=1472662 RepID=UPI0015874C29|nr:hypothetical protein [Streptomyces sp. CAI-85]NUV60769.1 hypothetical protein [Streptomyces sp. CAI-85]
MTAGRQEPEPAREADTDGPGVFELSKIGAFMKKHQRIATSCLALAASGWLVLGTTTTATADSTDSVQAAAIVERITGTHDLAAPVAGREHEAGRTVTNTPDGRVVIAVPAASDGTVEATAPDGTTFGVGLPTTRSVAGIESGAGTVVYPDAAPSTDLAVQPTVNGAVRSLVTLKDAGASTSQRFDLNLPAGTELVPAADGGYEIIERIDADSSVAIGAIAAPWAKDAAGKDVPTDYRLDGNSLVQRIHTTADTVFPVVADPSVSFGRGIYVKFNRSETASVAPYSDAASAVVAACQKVPERVRNMPVRTICRGTLGAGAQSVRKTFKSAASQNRCVQIRLPYAPIGVVIGWPEWKNVAC